MSRKDVMLAKPVNMNIVSRWEFIITQPKINGFHCRIKAKNGGVTLFTSQANIFSSVPHINHAVELQILRGVWPENFEIDGELYCHEMPLNEIQKRVKRSKSLHPDYKSIQFYAFDRMDQEDWNQLYRINELNNLMSKVDRPEFVTVPNSVAMNEDELQDQLEGHMSNSYEGIILRNPQGLYERKKSSYIFKFKPTQIDVYPIIGVKQLTDKDGFPRDELGSFVCVKDGAEFNVGTGPALKAWDRIVYWRERDKFINNPGKYLAVIKYPEFTGARAVPFQPVIQEVKGGF